MTTRSFSLSETAVLASSTHSLLGFRCFLSGLLLPLGFAPFHLAGLGLFSLLLLYVQLQRCTPLQSIYAGLTFGLGCFGLGVSWIYVSVHLYGHFVPLIAGLITFLFIVYLSCFIAGFCWLYNRCKHTEGVNHAGWRNGLLFSTLWVLTEYARAHLFTGFPWLLLGVSQFDTPLQGFLPILGVYGTSWLSCLTVTWLGNALLVSPRQRLYSVTAAIFLLLLPNLFIHYAWTQEQDEPIRVALIQANLSMRDKWDERLFWDILKQYQHDLTPLLGQDLIVLPESAIPLPAEYLYDYLTQLSAQAKQNNTALLLGIPKQVLSQNEPLFFNSLSTLGQATGVYLKRHLVPFGEYIPTPFKTLSQWLNIPDPAIQAGPSKQPAIKIKHHLVASLICYELAYEELLRNQLPKAEWIISISDDGWFGDSLAMYQQQQLAQVRSLQTGRYQLVSNNDGLSAILNAQGEIISALPPLSSGILQGVIKPMTGMTPWTRMGDIPILIGLLCLLGLHHYKSLARSLKKALSLTTRSIENR